MARAGSRTHGPAQNGTIHPPTYHDNGPGTGLVALRDFNGLGAGWLVAGLHIIFAGWLVSGWLVAVWLAAWLAAVWLGAEWLGVGWLVEGCMVRASRYRYQ